MRRTMAHVFLRLRKNLTASLAQSFGHIGAFMAGALKILS